MHKVSLLQVVHMALAFASVGFAGLVGSYMG
jgi:hypothetical protein